MKKLTIEDLIPGGKGYKKFLPLCWEEVSMGGDWCRYRKGDVYYGQTIKAGNLLWSLSLDVLNLLLRGVGVKDLKEMPTFHFFKKSAFAWFLLDDCICFVDCASPAIFRKIVIKPEWENILFNEEKALFSFTFQNGLYLLDMDGKAQLIHQDMNRNILAGAVPSRNEFGIEQGAFWSPDGNRLAFYIVDQTAVSSYPLVKIQSPMATVAPLKYPTAGSPSERVRLAVYDCTSGETVVFPTSDWQESYWTCVTWNPDGTAIFFAEVDRPQKHMRLLSFDASDGRFLATLFEEQDDKYVEPQHPLLFLDDGRFVWQSRRDGYNHLYLYSKEGVLLRQLTSGDYEVTKLCGYSEVTGELLYLSTYSSPLNRDICAVRVADGVMRILSKEIGTHSVAFSSKNAYFIDVYSSVTLPGKVVLRSLTDDSECCLYEALNPYEGYELPKVEIGSFLKEGEELFYRIVRPALLEEEKRYPLAYYVYGGPHVQLIRNEWMAGTKGFEYMMALNGYVVMSIDPHGSDNRGKAFEQRIWRNIGAVQTEDYRYSIEWLLREKTYVDSRRMGVYGWSFGGFMATRLLLRCPELFAFGVAGGAVMDWALYEVMYTERYMETPALNPQGYEENALCRFLDALSVDLLLIHGDNDPVVLWQHSLSFLKESVLKGKLVDYAVYPGYEHNVRGEGRVHLMQRVKRYFDQHCGVKSV
ncbi:MAG: DPP IV N-terminal domain-containing protein [Paludibacteraceae bacterium]|nr:DPP IV N-terminal domain-containing protein [Paludibacteraceae bacterium]